MDESLGQSSKSDEISQNNLVLRKIHKPLLNWLKIQYLIFIASVCVIYFTFNQEKSFKIDIEKLFYFVAKFNGELLSTSIIVGTILGVLFFTVFLTFFDGEKKEDLPLNEFQLYYFIVGCFLILVAIIFVTGGFLESPYTGSTAVFLTSFLIIQERPDFSKFNKLLITIAIFTLFLPYIGFYFGLLGKSYFILSWKDTRFSMSLRLITSALLLLLSIYYAHKVEKLLK